MKISPIKILYNDSQEVVSVDFGHGGRDEHDHGISTFYKSFGVNTNLEGMDKYAITTCPDYLSYEVLDYKNEIYHVLQLHPFHTFSGRRKHLPDWCVNFFGFKYSDQCRFGINAAWSQDEFIIIAHNNFMEVINSLYEAFTKKDIYLGYSPTDDNGLYHRDVLKFTIKSKVDTFNAEKYGVDLTGQSTYQHLDYMRMAEDFLYQKAIDNKEPLDKKNIKKDLKNITMKFRES